jgi:hypothetical protein
MALDNEEWLTLEQAYKHVLGEVILPERAEQELLSKFMTAQVATRAARIVVGGPNKKTIPIEGPLPSKTWRRPSIKLLTHENAAERINWGEEDRPWFGNRAEAVTVSARQLFQFWPKKVIPRSKKWSDGEIRTLDWLIDDIERRGTSVPKSERLEYARKQFRITKRGFNDRVYPEAAKKSGKERELMKAGRKPKSNRRTN